MAVAPTPSQAAKLTGSQLRAALKRSGRSRDFDTAIDRIQAVFRADYLRQRPQVEAAMGHQTLALLRQLDAACAAADDLAAATIAQFDKHPDAKILLSFPGLGPLTAARVLAEIGDDRTRFIDARALKAYAGASPVTRASGKSRVVAHRHIKNQRLAHAGYAAWVTGIRRVEAPTRANAPLISFDEAFTLVKINPLAAWSDQDVADYIAENNVVVNPLVDEGYPSIGCAPCTAKPAGDADPRSGRWQGRFKTECGLHGS